MNDTDKQASKERIQRKGQNTKISGSTGTAQRSRTPMRKIVIKDEMRVTSGGMNDVNKTIDIIPGQDAQTEISTTSVSKSNIDS